MTRISDGRADLLTEVDICEGQDGHVATVNIRFRCDKVIAVGGMGPIHGREKFQNTFGRRCAYQIAR